MANGWAIIIAGVIIGASILITNHWQIMQGQNSFSVYRLNRWTGTIDVCVLDPTTMKNPNSFTGAEIICKAK
jgi:hypothetical protein